MIIQIFGMWKISSQMVAVGEGLGGVTLLKKIWTRSELKFQNPPIILRPALRSRCEFSGVFFLFFFACLFCFCLLLCCFYSSIIVSNTSRETSNLIKYFQLCCFGFLTATESHYYTHSVLSKLTEVLGRSSHRPLV